MFPIYLCLDLFYFISFFQFYHPPPAQSNNIYHIFYDIIFEIHRHQPFNQCLFLFGCVDNTPITVLMLRSILSVFVISIGFFHIFHIFNIFISISMWRIIFISTRSICSFRIIIFYSFLNDLNPGGNVGMFGGNHWYFWSPKLFFPWFGIGSFLGVDVASEFFFILSLGMRFSGVTLALVYSVNRN